MTSAGIYIYFSFNVLAWSGVGLVMTCDRKHGTWSVVDVGHGATFGGDVAHVHLLGLDLDLWSGAQTDTHTFRKQFAVLTYRQSKKMAEMSDISRLPPHAAFTTHRPHTVAGIFFLLLCYQL